MPTPTPDQLAAIALDWWRSSGTRTLDRLDTLVESAAVTYYGPSISWPSAITSEVANSIIKARESVRPWEVTK